MTNTSEDLTTLSEHDIQSPSAYDYLTNFETADGAMLSSNDALKRPGNRHTNSSTIERSTEDIVFNLHGHVNLQSAISRSVLPNIATSTDLEEFIDCLKKRKPPKSTSQYPSLVRQAPIAMIQTEGDVS